MTKPDRFPVPSIFQGQRMLNFGCVLSRKIHQVFRCLGRKSGDTVDGQNPAPPGIYKAL